MADRQFVVGGQGNAPQAWLLSGALEIMPKIAYASFNGAAASGSFLPCLRLISDSGHVALEAVVDTTVAQGGSADVSWFRGMKPPCPPNGWPNQNAQNAVISFGPWAFWKLNEANGVSPALDSSGHGRSMTVGVASVTGGKQSIIPATIDTSSFVIWSSPTNVFSWASVVNQTWAQPVGTWSYWIRTAGHSTNELDLGCMGTISGVATRLFRHYLNSSGQPILEYLGTDAALHTLTFAVGLDDDTTHHVCFVLDGSNVSCYVDSALVSSQAQPVAMQGSLTSKCYIGQPAGGAGSRSYSGFIQQVGWFDKVLTPTNIAALYQAGTQLPA